MVEFITANFFNPLRYFNRALSSDPDEQVHEFIVDGNKSEAAVDIWSEAMIRSYDSEL